MSGITTLNERHRWLVFVLPFAVCMLAGSLEPSHDKPGGLPGLTIPYSAYPIVYTVKIALTLAAMALVLPGYREFRRPPGLLALAIGAIGIVVWVGLWKASALPGIAPQLAKIPGSGRPAFDPLTELAATPGWAWTFLGIRFFGLVFVVPVIEEFFLRGFLMRVVMEADWCKVPFGTVNKTAVITCIVYAVLTHPAELFAAAAWFGMVTWLMVRTAQSVGLRRRPRGDEPAAGHLRCRLAAMGVVVTPVGNALRGVPSGRNAAEDIPYGVPKPRPPLASDPKCPAPVPAGGEAPRGSWQRGSDGFPPAIFVFAL